MDDNRIFVKTAAGERAIRERTRLVQRNLRMVLILVESQITVGELKLMVSDPAIVDSAIGTLAEMGLVEPLAAKEAREHPASEAERPAAPADPPAAETVAEVEATRFGSHPGETVRFDANVVDAAAPGDEAQAAAAAEGPERREPKLRSVIRADELLGYGPAAAPAGKDGRKVRRFGSLPENFSFGRMRIRRQLAAEERDFAAAYDDRQAPAKLIPRLGERALSMGWRAWLAIVAATLLLLGALGIAAFPGQAYLRATEVSLGRALGSSVQIGGMRLSLLPYPNLSLAQIRIGAEPYAEIDEARVVPDPLSLFATVPVMRRVDIEHLNVKVAQIDRVAHWFAGESADFRLGAAEIRSLVVDLGGTRSDSFGAAASFSATGVLAKLALSNADGSLRLEAEPAGSLFRLSLTGKGWPLPLAGGLVPTAFEAKGELTARQLRLPKVEARLYDGLADGAGTLDWSDGVSLVGDLELRRANMRKLFAAIDPALVFDGEMGGTVRIEARAGRFADLGSAMRLDGRFKASRAVLNRFDVVQAAQAGGRGPFHAGNMKVDQVSGALRCDARACRIGRLKLSSGLMRAVGDIDIRRADGSLDGTVEVELHGSAHVVRVPLAVAGSFVQPELRRR